jgi:hypothetical protein
VQSVAARASAVRSLPSSSAISPQISPRPRRASTTSLPSGDGTLIRMVPLTTATMLSPRVPISKMVSFAGICLDPRVGEQGVALAHLEAVEKAALGEQRPCGFDQVAAACGRRKGADCAIGRCDASRRGDRHGLLADRTQCAVFQARAVRCAVMMSVLDISSAISRRNRKASLLPSIAAMLKHACAETKSIGVERPETWFIPSSKNSLPRGSGAVGRLSLWQRASRSMSISHQDQAAVPRTCAQ